MSIGEKIGRGVLRYMSLGRNAIVVIITTIIISIMTLDGTPPVQITGKSKLDIKI
jgi:hypothetical protein